VLTTGNPRTREEWARRVVAGCEGNTWGQAGAAEIWRLRTSADTARLAAAWRSLWFLRDSVLFETALAVARDNSAEMPARLHALAGLARLNRPIFDTWPADLLATRLDVRGRVVAVCVGRQMAGVPMSYAGTPLPEDWRQRLTSLGWALSNDTGQPAEIRSAGACVTRNSLYP
jgi:hypothetical protein